MKYQGKYIIQKLDQYKKDLDKQKKSFIECSSPSADKKRTFNLITIYKNKKADIKCSLCIDFLFLLKEKGNKFSHFDESIINYILFNDLNLTKEGLSNNQGVKIVESEIKEEKIIKTTKIDKLLNVDWKNDKNQIKDKKSNSIEPNKPKK